MGSHVILYLFVCPLSLASIIVVTTKIKFPSFLFLLFVFPLLLLLIIYRLVVCHRLLHSSFVTRLIQLDANRKSAQTGVNLALVNLALVNLAHVNSTLLNLALANGWSHRYL